MPPGLPRLAPLSAVLQPFQALAPPRPQIPEASIEEEVEVQPVEPRLVLILVQELLERANMRPYRPIHRYCCSGCSRYPSHQTQELLQGEGQE